MSDQNQQGMAVSIEQIEIANAQVPPKGGQSEYTLLSRALGTRGCLLHCIYWSEMRAAQLPVARNKRVRKTKRIAAKEAAKSKFEAGGKEDFDLEELDASAEAGCTTCEFLRSILAAFLVHRPHLDPKAMRFRWLNHRFILQLSNILDGTTTCVEMFRPSTDVGNTVRTVGMVNSNPLSGDTSSDSSLKWLRDCIDHCGENHELCRSCNDKSPLPSRLLHLTTLRRGGEEGCRLVSMSEGDMGTYCCLSHCWGEKTMPLKTLKSNLNEHLQFIAWHAFPKTFRDAAKIALALGIEYIWIDSLCIVQDDHDDWEAESAKMARIYSSSYVTIAAIFSHDFEGGCFSNAPRDMCFRVLRDDTGFDTTIGLREFSRVQYEDDFIFKDFPLLTRAWVYQERMLSRRLIYCTTREFQVTCRQKENCECGWESRSVHGVKKNFDYPGAAQRRAYAALFSPGGSRDRTIADISLKWQRTVRDFTKLKITYHRDKLPALSGCARDFAGLLHLGGYYAGLWQNTIGTDLLWFINDPFVARRPEEWRAPSWSWASIMTSEGIKFVQTLGLPQVASFANRVTAIECTPLGKDPMGRVQSGYLRLRTWMYRVPMRRLCFADNHDQRRKSGRLCLIETQEFSLSAEGERVRQRCIFPDSGLDTWNGRVLIVLLPDFEFTLSTFQWHRDLDNGCHCYQTTVDLLPVSKGSSKGKGRAQFRKAAGSEWFLALRKDPQGREQGYERVGLVSITGEKDTLQQWISAVLDFERRIDEQEITLV